MTEEQQVDELGQYYKESRKPLFRFPKNPLGRLGCGIMIVVWFMVLLLPCAMFYLATGGSITIPSSNLPEPEQHPFFAIQLIMEIDNRGLILSNSSLASETETQLCITSSINYLLWESDSSATNSQYCQCYERENAEATWVYSEQYEGVCRTN